MCCSRSHIHKPCGCTISHVYICPSFPIQPPPQALESSHRRYIIDTALNQFYTPETLALCEKSFFTFPDVDDPAPCQSHQALERDVRLVLGPPRAPDGAWDEFDRFAFRKRLREAGDGERDDRKDSGAVSGYSPNVQGTSNPTSITNRWPQVHHLKMNTKEGYESFPIVKVSDENKDNSGHTSEDEKSNNEKICIWPRIFSLEIGGRRGSVA